MNYLKLLGAVSLLLVLAACTAKTSFNAADEGLMLRINEDEPFAVGEATERTYATTSFGNYKFKASKEGADPMYGLIPLKFNGGYLAADILFFAPAMFFNLRGVFPEYEFDMDEGVIRYRLKPEDGWTSYQPSPAEADNARNYFGD